MNKLLTLNQNASPDNVLTFDTVTGEVQYSPKANITTPTTVTGTKPTGNTIGTINGTDIKETITGFGTPTITGKVVTLPYTDETGTVKNVAIDLTTILVDVKATAFVLDPITKVITITNSDGSTLTIDGTALMNLTQLADVISIIGTGTATDPFRLNFATRAMLDTGTDTTHAVNVAELKNQIQTNQYKFGKAVTTTTAGLGGLNNADTSTYVATLDYPITTLKDGEQFVIRIDASNFNKTNYEEPAYVDPNNPDPGVYFPTQYYYPNTYRLNISGTGDKKIYQRVGGQLVEIKESEIAKGNNTFTYDIISDSWILDTICKPTIPVNNRSLVTFQNLNNNEASKTGILGILSNNFTNGTQEASAILPINTLVLTKLPNTPITSIVDEWRLPIFATDNVDNVAIAATGTRTHKGITIAQLRYALKSTPKKYYSASTPLIVGETTITHNLGLTAPFAFLSDFRDPVTGASVGVRIKAGSKTANSYILISTIATNVEITNM